MLVNQKKFSSLKPWIFFLIAAGISLCVNIYWLDIREFLVSSMYLTRLIFYLLCIPIISQLFKKGDVRWLLSAVTLSLGVTVVIGLLQYLLYPDLRNLMYMGWDEHLYRIFSSFLDPNFTSVIYVICIWLLLLLTTYYKKNKYIYYLLIGSLVLTAVALLLTYSRTGYLAFIVSIFVYSVISKRLMIIIVLCAFFVIGIFLLPTNLRSEGVNLFRTASIFSRIESYQTAGQIFLKNPVLGSGFNTYRYAQQTVIHEKNNLEGSHAGAGVSNSYLFVLATTGIIGFLTFVYVIVTLFRTIYTISSPEIRASVSAIVTAVLAGSMTENIFFYSFILIILCSVWGIVKLITEKSVR